MLTWSTSWLARRPQRGRDVFACGQPEMFGVSVDNNASAIDGIGFLWASLALFDDGTVADTANVYQPAKLALHSVAQARERIPRRLSGMPDGAPLDQLLPEDSPDTGAAAGRALRRCSGWAATLVAGLELARQRNVVLRQGADFEPIDVAPA